MSWQCTRQLNSPWRGLPCASVAVADAVEIRLTLASDPLARPDVVTEWLRDLSGDGTLSITTQLRWRHDSLPPPWRCLSSQADEQALQQATKAELLLSLRLLRVKDLGRSPYASAKDSLNRFATQADSRGLMREALFFAFLDKPNLFARRGVTSHWLATLNEVVFERGGLTKPRHTDSSLIRLGYSLLAALQQLRALNSQEQMERLWSEFTAQTGDAPVTCAVVFWDEAVYRLSEINDMEAANALLAKQKAALHELARRLPGLDASDLLAGMWHHHFGRLAYYRGDMTTALEQFGNEWRLRDRLNETDCWRLYRSCANVLTDLGYLTTAEALTRTALTAQENAGEPELFKTYGRLAEILIRQDRYPEAKAAYEQSWRLQLEQSPNNGDEADAQTAVYLGHVNLLLRDFEAAETYYLEAATRKESRLNPYLSMGWAAYYYRTGQVKELDELWKREQTALTALRGEKVLPKAVIYLARHLTGRIGQEQLTPVLEELTKENYWLEVCFLLPYLFPEPAPAARVLEDIQQQLGKWRQTADEFCRLLPDAATATSLGQPPRFSLTNALDDLDQALAANSWADRAYLQQIYPFKLLLA